MDWKETVSSVTSKVLSREIHKKIVENEVLSNLPLQMSLYFNVILFPIWLLATSTSIYDKFHCYSEFTAFVIICITATITFIEVLRLYLGYEGNLQDKIPEVASFWILSILLQFPLQTFLLLNPHFKLEPLHKTVQTVMYLLLLMEIFAGYMAIKHTSNQQAIYFKIMKLKSKQQ